MSLHKVHQIFISDGTAVPAGGSAITTANIASGDLAVIGKAMSTLTAGNTVADSDKIFIAQGSADTVKPIKMSAPIIGREITNWAGVSYKPAARETWAIGYDRKLAAGLIEANNSSDYDFKIVLKYDNNLHTERNLTFSKTITSDSTATQLEIADKVRDAINNDATLKSLMTAITIGNGTGALGLTAATAWGVEVYSDIQTQNATSYFEDRVGFSIYVDDASGFGTTTTCTQIQSMTYGSGMYQQVYNMENFAFGYEGVTNRRSWPIPTLTYAAANTFFDSAAIVPTASTTIGEDKVTFSATVANILEAGDRVVLDAVNYEIRYFISNTVAVVVGTFTTTNGTGAVKKRLQYDLLTIEHSNPKSSEGANVVDNSKQWVVIAAPAIDAAGAWNSNSSALTGLLAILNPYMASLNFAGVTV